MLQHPKRDSLSGYVLDLISAQERKRIEEHIVECDRCMESIQVDRQIEQLVSTTIRSISVPSASSLQKLMPDIPPHGSRADRFGGFPAFLHPLVWQPVVALVVISVLFFGSMSFNMTSNGVAISTSTSTATMTSTTTGTAISQRAGHFSVHNSPMTPMPAATPIAQLSPAPRPKPINN